MSKKQLTITIISVIILALIGGGVVWYLKTQKQEVNPLTTVTEKKQEELNFRTYRNNIIGIEFQYPYSWPTLKPDDRGDILKDGKISDSFYMSLIDFSSLSHSPLSFDNKPVYQQFEKIKCQDNIRTVVYCEEKISNNGARYVWKIYDLGINDPTKAGSIYYAFVPTGKYILTFSFQGEDNYKKRAKEYQQLLSTLKIIP